MPDKAATMPAMVGMVALKIPAAMERALPEPENAMTWNTSIIPDTVPNKPISGHKTTQVLINSVFLTKPCETIETNRALVNWAYSELKSVRSVQIFTALLKLFLCCRLMYMIRSIMSAHMMMLISAIR